MNQIVFLDIDGVLLPWDDEAYSKRFHGGNTPYDPSGDVTGFTDWERVPDHYFTHVSRQQIELIRSLGEVVWLTTWMTHDMHPTFEEKTGAGPWQTMYDRLSGTLTRTASLSWWKANLVLDWVADGGASVYDRVLWVDDDHADLSPWTADKMDETFIEAGVEVHRIAPLPVWKRSEIELWLP